MTFKSGIVYFLGTIFLLVVSSCSEKKVIITKDYVINPNWDEVDNSFTVYRMKLKDSTQVIDLKDPSEPELYHGLIKDTSFAYTANVKYNGEDYAKRKVYFNRVNDFVWRKPPDIDLTRSSEYKFIGELQPKTWYLLAGLSKVRTLYYVYIDSSDGLHVFKVSTMTNY
jgi:hypothetical protein